jgi:hypothetical protein
VQSSLKLLKISYRTQSEPQEESLPYSTEETPLLPGTLYRPPQLELNAKAKLDAARLVELATQNPKFRRIPKIQRGIGELHTIQREALFVS